VEWLAEKITDLLRPFYEDGLPEELSFGDIESWGFVRGSMNRAARLAVSQKVDFGVFGVLGIGYARRAARVWWPKERMLMEEVSCAFQPIQSRAGAGQMVPQIQRDRLMFVLARYLAYIGSPWDEEQLREAVDQFIRQAPRNKSDESN